MPTRPPWRRLPRAGLKPLSGPRPVLAEPAPATEEAEFELGEYHVEQEEPVAEAAPAYGEGQDDSAPAAPRVATGGGTLFERMSSLSRGLTRGNDEPEEDNSGGVNIPRFLDRQSNS